VFYRYRVRHSVPFSKAMLLTAIGAFAVLISVLCWPLHAHARSGRSTFTTAPSARRSKNSASGDQNFTGTRVPNASGSRSRRTGNTGHPGYRTYNPKSIERFWSLYHGGRTEGKGKRLEREK
jgi:hypothetical protein